MLEGQEEEKYSIKKVFNRRGVSVSGYNVCCVIT